MRKAGSLILALLVTLALGGLVSTAQAAPVVDQYTEQLPSPGGPVPVDPTNPGQPAPVPVSNPGIGGDSGSTAAGETAVDNGAASETAGEAGNGGDGNGSKPAEGAGQEANGPDGNTEDSIGVFTTSGDDGDGMGWLFPAGLLLVVLAVIGIALTRRTRHNPATR